MLNLSYEDFHLCFLQSNTLPTELFQQPSLMFSKSFIVLYFTFRSRDLTHFELILIEGVAFRMIFPPFNVQLFQLHLLKILFPPPNCFSLLKKKISLLFTCVGLFQDVFYSTDLCFNPPSIPHCQLTSIPFYSSNYILLHFG